MKKMILSALALTFFALPSLLAQKYFTKEGHISFFSEAPVEKIEAHNHKAVSVMDAATGAMEFAVLIKAFQFEKALMQEHFNENYMESDKFPKAKFQGSITNMGSVDLNKDGVYPVKVAGELTIHGISQPVESEGKIAVKDGNIRAEAAFEVAVADYEIEIPAVVRDNIAKIVRIDVEVDYQELNR